MICIKSFLPRKLHLGIASTDPTLPATMPRSSRRIDGAAVALAVYLGTVCALTACLALGLYELMQPTRSTNPGLAAYKPPPRTVIDLASPAPAAPLPESSLGSVERPLETIATLVPERQSEADKTKTELKTKRPKRQRAARRKERRSPMSGYAFQPYFGGYRSWY